jgi:hypothetical protein
LSALNRPQYLSPFPARDQNLIGGKSCVPDAAIDRDAMAASFILEYALLASMSAKSFDEFHQCPFGIA